MILKKKKMKITVTIIGYVVLLLIACIMVVPFLYMFLTSLKVTYSAYNFKFSLDELTLANYVQIIEEKEFIKYFLNSTIIAVSGVIISVVFSSLAGFAFAQKQFYGKEHIFLFMLATLIIPSTVTMLPLYIIMRQLDWLNTFYALILPIPTAMGVFLMRQAMLGIPRELIEAARIDGCSDLRIFIQIVLPLVKPAIITLTIFTFIGAWNEFLWPLIATTDGTVRTLTVGLSTMRSQYTVNYGLVMAGATLTFLPSFIIYMVLQSKFIEGVTLSGVKG